MSIKPDSSVYFFIKNRKTGKVLNTKADGTLTGKSRGRSNTYQWWKFQEGEYGLFISNGWAASKDKSIVLDCTSDGDVDGHSKKSDNTYQMWHVLRVGDTKYFNIVGAGTDKVLRARSDGGIDARSGDYGSSNRQWELVPADIILEFVAVDTEYGEPEGGEPVWEMVASDELSNGTSVPQPDQSMILEHERAEIYEFGLTTTIAIGAEISVELGPFSGSVSVEQEVSSSQVRTEQNTMTIQKALSFIAPAHTLIRGELLFKLSGNVKIPVYITTGVTGRRFEDHSLIDASRVKTLLQSLGFEGDIILSGFMAELVLNASITGNGALQNRAILIETPLPSEQTE